MDFEVPGELRKSALVWVRPSEWLYVRSGWISLSSVAVSFFRTACFQVSMAARTSVLGSAAESDRVAAVNTRSHLSIGLQHNADAPRAGRSKRHAGRRKFETHRGGIGGGGGIRSDAEIRSGVGEAVPDRQHPRRRS